MKQLIRIDRNGTKYYQEVAECERCQGRGWFATGVCNGQLVPSRVDNAVCWECHGSGKMLVKTKEYTPEHAEKLARNREKAQAKRAAEKEASREAEIAKQNAKFLEMNGFSQDGYTWLVLGDTYSKKDEIKAAGGKYSPLMGWHIDHEVDGYQLLKVSVEEVTVAREGFIEFNLKYDWEQRKRDALKELTGAKESEYIGAVGEKVEADATLKNYGYYTTQFGDVNVYTFADADGNLIVWKTSAYIDKEINGRLRPIEVGDRVQITGKVKEQSEYRGEKQTVLTRCKVKVA